MRKSYFYIRSSCRLLTVTSGIKPASLGKVNDPQIKHFIEKCLLPASMRLPAAELLKDPFLLVETPKGASSCPLVNLIQNESHLMEIDPNCKTVLLNSSTRSIEETPQFSTLELRCFTEINEFRLKGVKNDDNTISLTLRIADQCGVARNIHFSFYLDSDTAISIAEEMVEQLDLSNEDVAVIAELIDSMILKLVPCWKPSFRSISCIQYGLCNPSRVTITTVGEQDVFPRSAVAKCQDTEESFGSDISAESEMIASDGSNNKPMGSSDHSYSECHNGLNMYDFGIDIGAYNHLGHKETSDEKNHGEYIVMKNSRKNSETSLMDSCSFASQDTSLSSIGCLSPADKDKLEELKLELDALDSQYQQCFQELVRMREEAMENAKKRWLTKKKVSEM